MRPLTKTYIEPTWAGETVAIMARGPSLAELDLSLFDRFRVVAINEAWRIYPKAHTAFGGDWRFFRTIEDWTEFKGQEIVCLSPEGWKNTPVSKDPRAIHVGRGEVTGLATDRTVVSGRRTCVTQCLSYLVHRGVAGIIIAGVDLHPSPAGCRYAFSSEKVARWQERDYRLMYENFKGFVRPLKERGVHVYNVSENSRLRALWSFTPLEECLP